MKRIKIWAATVASSIALAIAGFLLIWFLAGVRAAHTNLVIATFAVHGIEDSTQVAELRERLGEFSGFYDGAVSPHLSAEKLWLARVQFKASDPAAGQAEIRRWLAAAPANIHAEPVLATFYECRLERPGRGDLVFGDSVSILPLR